jgi:serine/threonine protein kinase
LKKLNVSGPSNAPARELKMLCQLSHPNIIRIFGQYTRRNNNLFLVLELGIQSLRDFLVSQSPGRLPFSQALTFALHVSQGIMHLHSQDVIHLDIKSPNVIICDGGVAKITDFGSARKMITSTTQSTLGKAGCGRYT